ncbi:GNAT family protein [Candidatus Amarobacter glycogenicus]|uniref:GNAT family N-acetyltransferase n=1 Tax=Candidatus Amarobacter glycogenicus TaxID=3140699 RepID=UPI0031370656|nr:GNAT family N-acetyltransferase [Dehalococcoidia bacterium]
MTALATLQPVQPVTLEGEHVRLEPLSMAHVDALVAASSEDRSNYQWTFVPEGEDATCEYVSAALELAARSAAVPFATVHRATGRVVGSTRFANFEFLGWPPSSPHYRGEGVPDGVEIGWTWLAASVQRTPVNTEAKWLMLRHAFASWGVRVVRLNTDRRNVRSRAAIERIGGRLDGVIRANRAASDGAVRDTATYSIIESEWPAADAALRARLA